MRTLRLTVKNDIDSNCDHVNDYKNDQYNNHDNDQANEHDNDHDHTNDHDHDYVYDHDHDHDHLPHRTVMGEEAGPTLLKAAHRLRSVGHGPLAEAEFCRRAALLQVRDL